MTEMRRVSMDDIMAEVVDAARRVWGSGATQEGDIIGRNRGDRIAACRAVFVGLCRRRTGYSIPEIAQRMHRRNWSGVMSSSNRFDEAIRGYGVTRADAMIVELMAEIEKGGRG